MDNFNAIYWIDTLSKIRTFSWVLVFTLAGILLLLIGLIIFDIPFDRIKNPIIICSVSFLYSLWNVVMIPGKDVLNKLFESGNSMVVKQLLLYIHKGTSVMTYILFTIYFILKIVQMIGSMIDKKHITNNQEEDESE